MVEALVGRQTELRASIRSWRASTGVVLLQVRGRYRRRVRRACEQAGVPFARIVETYDFSPSKEEQ